MLFAVLLGLGVVIVLSSGGRGGRAISREAQPVRPSPVSGSPADAPRRPGCPAPRRIEALTFNIRDGLDDQNHLRLGRIAAEIRASGAGIVMLQEVDRFRRRTDFVDEPTLLAHRLHMRFAYGTNLVFPPSAPGRRTELYGTAILSRYPILSSTNTHLPNGPAPLEQRGLLEATISVGGERVHVFDTHLEVASGSMRVTQIGAVRALVAPVTGPVILGGDFNSIPTSEVVSIARSFLSDTWAQVGHGPGLTHGQQLPLIRIDYQFHNDWLTPLAAQVLPSAVSDHHSVWAEYDLWSRAGCGGAG